jgi:nucleotidyltransferase substrate binding protein (TIGR01987 family)
MDRLRERLAIARRALQTLRELSSGAPGSDVVRDASIQRFEYTFEALWKAAQLCLRQVEGLEAGSPKGVIRSCFQVGLLEEAQTRLALEMTDDRNLTAHTYNEVLAEAIYSRIPTYVRLMEHWLHVMEERAERA